MKNKIGLSSCDFLFFAKYCHSKSKVRLNMGAIGLHVCAAIESPLKVFLYCHVAVHLRHIFRSKLACG